MTKDSSYTGKDKSDRSITVVFEEVTLEDMLASATDGDTPDDNTPAPPMPEIPVMVIVPKDPTAPRK